MATAKHKAIDLLRRDKLLDRKHAELGVALEARQETEATDVDAALRLGRILAQLAPVEPEVHGLVALMEIQASRITALYDALAQLTPSPIVELNRAVAFAMAFGPAAGLEIVDGLQSEPSLRNYHLLPSVRGDFLARLGRFDEARKEFERAASLTQNVREKRLLLDRAAACRPGDPPGRAGSG